MKSQRKLIEEDGIKITRIFIIPEGYESEYKKEIDKHVESLINCKVLVEPASNGETGRDCIIIDDKAVSFAIDIDAKTGFRSAIISYNKNRLQYYEKMWNELYEEAQTYEEWIGTL